MNVDIELKIKMNDGKEVILNNDEAKELLGKLKEIFPDPVYIPPTPVFIQEPYRWWEKVWYSDSGTITITNKIGKSL